jgi:pimeloyl-ACP methyl ester carboxylesterase
MKLRERLVAGIVGVATSPVRIPPLGRLARGDLAPLRIRSADGTMLHADVFSPRAPCRGTAILAHGYRDGRAQLTFLVAPLALRGYRVVAFDFRGHGRSDRARLTIGAREADDVRAVMQTVRGMQGCGDVAFLGYSMGASAYLLSGVEADRAVLDSPYDTLEEALSARVRLLGFSDASARTLASEGAMHMGVQLAHARPIDFVAGLTRPTLFVFGRRDRWVDEAARADFARKLPAAGAIRVVRGGHKGHFSAQWRREVVDFLAPEPGHISQTTE